MAFDKQKIQAIIDIIQKIVGARTVNPLVDFKNHLMQFPRLLLVKEKYIPRNYSL